MLLIGAPFRSIAAEQEAIFAGGCFWCLEHDLESLPGVISAKSGYSGGDLIRPTYGMHGGHQEAVLVSFDSEKISYPELLRSYWRNVDPLDGDGQFCDRGDSYRPVIFVKGDQQERDAIFSAKAAANELGLSASNIKIQIQKATKFWLAEDYHQDFAKKNNLKYSLYRFSCGRDSQLDELWGERARTGKGWAK